MLNENTEYLANMSKHIDKFHFGNHIDAWCQTHCNLDHVANLKGVNSQIWEQIFRKLNAHKNCKTLSESRFFFMFLYCIVMHNLSLEGLEMLAGQRLSFQWENITIHEVDLSVTH